MVNDWIMEYVYWTYLSYCIVINFTILCSAQDIQQLAVTAGSDITLPCTVTSDHPSWTGPEQYNGYTQPYNAIDESSFSNPYVPQQKRSRLEWGSDKSSLIIRDVILSDKGLYQCSSVAKINLTVRVPPSSPEITNTESEDGTLIIRKSQSQETTLVCISSGGYPQPIVEWYRGNTGTQVLTSTSSVNSETNSYTVIQTYRFIPKRQDDGVKYICQSSFETAPSLIATTSAELLLILMPNPPTVVQTSVVSAGKQAVIRCTATGSRPAASITWSYRNTIPSGEETTTLNDVTKTYTVTSLLKLQVTAQDNGQTVHCKITHTLLVNPPQLTASVKLNVTFKPLSTTITGDTNIIANGRNIVNLTCTSDSSNPVSDITWRNNSVITPATGNLTDIDGNYGGKRSRASLTFTPTRYNDGDNISCEAINKIGTSERRAKTLDLRYSPMIIPMSDITVIEGDIATFTCKASSKPVSSFKWYRGQDVVLKEGTGSLGNNGLTFTMKNVSRSDAVTYKCNASNGVEAPDNKKVILTVQYPPEVKVIARNTTVNASRLIITCNATGVPNTGFQYGKWVQKWPGYQSSLKEYSEGDTLELENLTYQHSGIYICSASNGIKVFGTNKEFIIGSVLLVVESFPMVTHYNDKVWAKLGANATVDVDYYSNVAESGIKLYKNVNGSKEGKHIYYVLRTEIQVDLRVFNHSVKTNGTKAQIIIPIKSKEDLGVYDVVVSNRIGQVMRSIQIDPKGPPSVPTNITVDEIQYNSVRITWIAGYHGGAPQRFVIETSSNLVNWSNDSINGGLSESTDPMSFLLSHLSSSTTYYVKMYAINKEGISQFTEILNFTTSDKIDGDGGSGSSALIGGAAGGGVAVVVIVVVLLVIFLKRRGTFTKGKAKSNDDYSDRKPVNDDADDYGKKENEKKEKNKKGHMKDKKGRKEIKEGYTYENSSPSELKKASAKQMNNDETIYENPEQEKNVNKDGLIYADLTFNDHPKDQKKLVIHGLDSRTEYVDVDFTKKADPLPDSDDENVSPK